MLTEKEKNNKLAIKISVVIMDLLPLTAPYAALVKIENGCKKIVNKDCTVDDIKKAFPKMDLTSIDSKLERILESEYDK